MKTNFKNQILKFLSLGILIFAFFGCQNDESNFQDPKLSRMGEIFLDRPVAMGTLFYLPYNGSKLTAWQVDDEVSYLGTSSMRIDVPNANDAQGSYAGAILRVDGAPRDLSNFDALTFWVRASQGVTIGEFGFGEDFIENKFITSITNVSIGTAWTKIIIPIPDASKLTAERGMFRYAAGSQGTNGNGYTFWVDELKFEKLGTIAHGQASIMNGANVSENTYVGVNSAVEGAIATFNLPTGINQSVSISSAYLNYVSSNPSVASVDSNGLITSLSPGTTVITANFGDTVATGSITINCQGTFISAPVPTRPQANVISLFSDAYNNVPVNYYNGYWQPWQTTVSNDFTVQGDNILNYTIFNFVGIEFSNPTINANAMTHVHLDVFFPGAIAPGRQLRVLVVDFGANGVFGGGDDTRHSTTFTAPTLISQQWIGIDIPFSAMPNLASRSHLAQLILEGGDGSVLFVDNIYYYN